MSQPKETLPEKQWEAIAEQFKLLSDSSRLKILVTLCQRGECNVKEICEHTGLSSTNVSKHLQLFRNAGVLACRREGSCRYYRIVNSGMLDLCALARRGQELVFKAPNSQ
jgi:DNA-binding transcriptional ArsR family regulator